MSIIGYPVIDIYYFWIYNIFGYPKIKKIEKRCCIMVGRPKKDDSRDKQYRVRLNSEEDSMLKYASSKTGKLKSEIFRHALVDYYNKVRLIDSNDCYEIDDSDDHISLKRVIECPFCGFANLVDFSDYASESKCERQMGPEFTYEFDVEDYECEQCDRKFHISGYICEYPFGAFNSENIKVEKSEEDE